jgi:hypothetical protein
VVPLKNWKKKWGHFLKMDILKMSIFQNLGVNVSQKVILLVDALNTKKIILNLLAYFFYYFLAKRFREIFISKFIINGNKKLSKKTHL